MVDAKDKRRRLLGPLLYLMLTLTGATVLSRVLVYLTPSPLALTRSRVPDGSPSLLRADILAEIRKAVPGYEPQVYYEFSWDTTPAYRVICLGKEGKVRIVEISAGGHVYRIDGLRPDGTPAR